MDISQINDPKELKVMAYDAMAQIEQGQANLKVINQRIAQIMEAEAVNQLMKKTKSSKDAPANPKPE